jgi:hypothetical protein
LISIDSTDYPCLFICNLFNSVRTGNTDDADQTDFHGSALNCALLMLLSRLTSLSHQFHTNNHKNVKTLLCIVTNYGISKKIQEKGNYFKSIVRTKEQDLYG